MILHQKFATRTAGSVSNDQSFHSMTGRFFIAEKQIGINCPWHSCPHAEIFLIFPMPTAHR
ncbi:hypothetical protein PM8797T_04480 [Gimesia maris DSM 8797]|nr:hypothetical protein PM8797T_04480 [Gimesia maris DSM 8797]